MDLTIRARRLMRSYARLQGTQSTIPNIRRDLAGDGNAPDDDTVSSYLNALRKIFVVEDSEAWCPALRSRTAVRLSPTRYFSDPSIATASLGPEAVAPSAAAADGQVRRERRPVRRRSRARRGGASASEKY